MGFKSATKSQYIVDNVVFPSKRDYELIKHIDQQLLNFICKTQIMNYGQPRMSCLRESRLKNLIKFLTMFRNNFVAELRETEDSAFAGLFEGIINFLYRGRDYENEDFSNDNIKRIINLASDLWDNRKFNRLNFKPPIGGFFMPL